jgi:hypothetical protein
MLPDALTALAAAGGAAVVQAAGSDAWEGLHSRLARWFGRGEAERERAELQRLDRSAAELVAAAADTAERVRERQKAVWTTRIETLLENLDDDEQRAQATAELQQLLEEKAPASAKHQIRAVVEAEKLKTTGLAGVRLGEVNASTNIDSRIKINEADGPVVGVQIDRLE